MHSCSMQNPILHSMKSCTPEDALRDLVTFPSHSCLPSCNLRDSKLGATYVTANSVLHGSLKIPALYEKAHAPG